MYLENILKEKGITKYQLSKLSGIPKTTILDICSGKTNLFNCKTETVYRIANTLNITIDELLKNTKDEKQSMSFENFKSTICHLVKDLGWKDFLIQVLESNQIRILFNKEEVAKSLYLLSMVDYLSRIHQIDLCSEYSDIRCLKLEEPLYPQDAKLIDDVLHTNKFKTNSYKKAIPEFLIHNIIEGDVFNVC